MSAFKHTKLTEYEPALAFLSLYSWCNYFFGYFIIIFFPNSFLHFNKLVQISSDFVDSFDKNLCKNSDSIWTGHCWHVQTMLHFANISLLLYVWYKSMNQFSVLYQHNWSSLFLICGFLLLFIFFSLYICLSFSLCVCMPHVTVVSVCFFLCCLFGWFSFCIVSYGMVWWVVMLVLYSVQFIFVTLIIRSQCSHSQMVHIWTLMTFLCKLIRLVFHSYSQIICFLFFTFLFLFACLFVCLVLLLLFRYARVSIPFHFSVCFALVWLLSVCNLIFFFLNCLSAVVVRCMKYSMKQRNPIETESTHFVYLMDALNVMLSLSDIYFYT